MSVEQLVRAALEEKPIEFKKAFEDEMASRVMGALEEKVSSTVKENGDKEVCDHCDGKGYHEENDKKVECPECNGTGYKEDNDDDDDDDDDEKRMNESVSYARKNFIDTHIHHRPGNQVDHEMAAWAHGQKAQEHREAGNRKAAAFHDKASDYHDKANEAIHQYVETGNEKHAIAAHQHAIKAHHNSAKAVQAARDTDESDHDYKSDEVHRETKTLAKRHDEHMYNHLHESVQPIDEAAKPSNSNFAFDMKSKEHMVAARNAAKAAGLEASNKKHQSGGEHVLHVRGTAQDVHKVMKPHASNMNKPKMGSHDDMNSPYGHRLNAYESFHEENISEMVKPSNTPNPAAHRKAAAYHIGQAEDHKEALKQTGMETSYYNDHRAAHKAHMAAADSHTSAAKVHKTAGAGDQNRIMDRTVMANKKSEAAKSASQKAND